MPQCVAFGCFNRTGGKQNDPPDVSFHSLPLKRPVLLKTWLHRIGREGFTPTKTSKLCSKHFLPNCYKENLYARYVGLSPGKKAMKILLEDAVPTEFMHRHDAHPVVKSARSDRLQKRQETAKKKEFKEWLLAPIGEDYYASVPSSDQKVPVAKKSTAAEMETSASVEHTCTQAEESSGTLFLSVQQDVPPPSKKRKAAETDTIELLEVSHEQSAPLVSVPSSSQQDIHIQSSSLFGTPRRTKLDHAYFTKPVRTVSTQTPSLDNVPQTASTSDVVTCTISPSDMSESESSEVESAANLSVEYLPSSSSEIESTSDSDENQMVTDPCRVNKFIVFEDCLTELLKFCKECGSPVVQRKQFLLGSMVGYQIACHSGHTYVWRSQPLQNKQPVGNLLIAAAILFSGNTFTKISAFGEILNLQLFSATVYNKIQSKNLLPVVQETWKIERNKAIEKVRDSEGIVLSGDGRCDSPGHNAKYGSYALMHGDAEGKPGTRQIVALNLVQVSEVKNSHHLEVEGLRRCLKDLEETKTKVSILATDQHKMVASVMKKEYVNIEHQFDVWHMAKNMVKKLTAKAKTKGCEELGPWIQSISNHLWWACSTCKGDEQNLREKWMSVLHHITNKHSWTVNRVVHRCEHQTLSAADRKDIKWLKGTSKALSALKTVVTNNATLKAMTHMTKFCHTGELEVFHSMLLKYCPKRQHFHYDVMYARLMLAAIEWNNTSREEKLDKSGKPASSVVYSKRRKAFVLRSRYKRVKTNYLADMMKRVYETHRDKEIISPFKRPPDLPKNTAPVAQPSKEELLKKFQSRYKSKV